MIRTYFVTLWGSRPGFQLELLRRRRCFLLGAKTSFAPTPCVSSGSVPRCYIHTSRGRSYFANSRSARVLAQRRQTGSFWIVANNFHAGTLRFVGQLVPVRRSRFSEQHVQPTCLLAISCTFFAGAPRPCFFARGRSHYHCTTNRTQHEWHLIPEARIFRSCRPLLRGQLLFGKPRTAYAVLWQP